MNKTVSGLCVALLPVVLMGAAQAKECSDPDPLRIAFIPQTTGQVKGGHYDKLMDVIGEELGRDVALLAVGSYSAVVEGLFNGSVDLAELGPGSYALARDRGTDITAFAAQHQQADATAPAAYHSVLITRRDSGIRKLDDLKGASLGLVDPASTSGGIVPRVAVQRMTGVSLEGWFGRLSYAGAHDLAIDAVLNRRVAAAFVADSWVTKATYRQRPAADALRIIWRSDPIPTDPFVYQNRLCEPVKTAIRRAFFDRQEDLGPFFAWRGRDGFVAVSDADYQQLMQNIQAQR